MISPRRSWILLWVAAFSSASPLFADVRSLPRAASFGSTQVAASDSRVGVSLPSLESAGPIFVDAMKQAGPWSSSSPLRVDAFGNVTSLGRDQVAQTTIFPTAPYPSGDYTLSYDGTGTLEVAGATTLERGPGRAILRISARPGGIRLRLSATAPSDPVRNIRLVLPGFAATSAEQPFLPNAVAALRQFHVLRFERWSQVAGDTSVETWPFRASPSNATQAGAGGVAPEYMIALANATGDDPWFVLPVGATDSYISHLAQLVRATLDPRLRPIFQFAEDPLAPGSATSEYATVAGLAQRRASDPSSAAVLWHVARSVDALDTVALASAGGRVRPLRVLGLPAAGSGATQTRVARVVLAAGAGHADALAVGAALSGGDLVPALAAAAAGARLAVFAADFEAQPGLAGRTPSVRGAYEARLERWHAAGGALAIVPGDASDELWAGARAYALRHPSPPEAFAPPGGSARAVAALEAVATAAATSKPTATPTPKATATPTAKPTPTPKPTPTATPHAAGPYVAPTCAHYVTNPECATLPPNPVVTANSTAIANEAFAGGRSGNFMFSSLPVSNPTAAAFSTSNPTADLLGSDSSHPYNVIPFATPVGTGPTQGKPLTVKCDNTDYGTGLNDGYVCQASIVPIDGQVFWIPNNYVQEMGSDGHLILVNPYLAAPGHAPGGEFDFWLAGEVDFLSSTFGPKVNADGSPDSNGSCYQNAVNSCRPGPPSNVGDPNVLSPYWNRASALHIGGGGYCAWDSDGTACSGADAINLAMTIGTIDPATLAYVDKYGGWNGSLPFALDMGAICALPENYGSQNQYVGFVYPANNSDGALVQGENGCTLKNAPAEGTRFFINRTDYQIDQLSVPNFMKVILRTMDKSHYGAFVGDSQWNQSSFGFASIGTNGGYAAWQFALNEAGIVPSDESGVTLIPFLTGVGGPNPLTAADIVFCKSGTCK